MQSFHASCEHKWIEKKGCHDERAVSRSRETLILIHELFINHLLIARLCLVCFFFLWDRSLLAVQQFKNSNIQNLAKTLTILEE